MDYKKLSIIIFFIIICAVSAYFILDGNNLNKESANLNVNNSTINDIGLIMDNSNHILPFNHHSSGEKIKLN